MLLFLIFLILLAIAINMFAGIALEVVGAVLGILIVLIIYFVRRKKRQ